MKNTKTTIVGLLLAQALETLAICANGEVGIGRKQIYQLEGDNNVLVNDHWVIATNNCHDVGISGNQFKNDACSAGPGYGDGNGLNDCDGSGKPGFVWTKGGNFHDCYNVGTTCETGPYLFEDIYWCCKKW
jgi:hypothetical protein